MPACHGCAVAFAMLLLETHALEVLYCVLVVFLILWITRTCATLGTSYSECPTVNVLNRMSYIECPTVNVLHRMSYIECPT